MMDEEEAEWYRLHGAALGVGSKPAGTDYAKWAAYDLEGDLARSEDNFVSEDFREAAKLADGRSRDQFIAAGDEALELAAALKSQAAVEALKAAEGMGSNARRRRKKESQETMPFSPCTELIKETKGAVAEPEPASRTVGKPDSDSAFSESKGIITSLSDIINKTSLQFARLIEEMKLLNKGVDTGSDGASVMGMELIKKVDIFAASSLQDAKDIETRAIAGGLKGMAQVKSSMDILKKIEESAKGMAMQVAAKTALVALRTRRYALAADVTRYWLKSTQAESATARAAEDQRRQMKGVEGTRAAQEDRDAERQGAAAACVWMLRSIAFLGMQCTYLCNTHVRQALRLCPDFPRLQLVQKCVEDLEELQMSQLNTSSHATMSDAGNRDGGEGVVTCNADLVKRQIRGMTHHLDFISYRKMSCSSSSLLRDAHDCIIALDMHELSERTLRSLYDPSKHLPLPDKKGKVTLDVCSVEGGTARLHMTQPEEEVSEFGREEWRRTHDSSGAERNQGTTELLLESEVSSLLRVLHEEYYQAQLLYLESLYRSAGFKYCAVAVVVSDYLMTLPQRDGVGSGSMSLEPYLNSLLACSLINASACRAFSGQYEKSRRVDVPVTTLEAEAEKLLRGPVTCDSVTQADPLVLCYAGLQHHVSLLGCVRGALVAEEMCCYQQGLSLLDKGWAVLLPDLDAEALAGMISRSGPPSRDQVGMETLWETVWTRCQAVIKEQSDETTHASSTGSASATAEIVSRYPRKQKFSQAFLCGKIVEPIGANLMGRLEEVARGSTVLEPQEVPPLVAHLHTTSARLRFKQRRFEGQ